MPNYWEKQIFSLGSFPEVGQKKERKRKTGNNNGQLRKAAWAKNSHIFQCALCTNMFLLLRHKNLA